jgi:hypothetical protein
LLWLPNVMTDQNWFAAAPWFWPMYNLLVSERFH